MFDPDTTFPTPAFLQLWDEGGSTAAALALLTATPPFEDKPEWILPYISEDGIDFEALKEHWFSSHEEHVLVAMAASGYGFADDSGPVGVRLGEALGALSPNSFLSVVLAMALAADVPPEFVRSRWSLETEKLSDRVADHDQDLG